ncbi:MAG: hypothetical protein IIB42_10515 [Candidatus Marinimicrobia bacterium]|nr:hypothetical protein [Candidatus Neomarinimicrobiota bacterium]
MEDRLPHISIRIEIAPREFLRRFRQVALQSGEYLVEAVTVPTEELQLAPLLVTGHQGLAGSLRPDPHDIRRVWVNITAERWDPDPPTYQAYVEAAHAIFSPLLHSYNQAHGTTRRLNIPSLAHTEPQLPEIAREVFQAFVSAADKRGLKREDWSRLFDFIRHCTSYNVALAERDLVRLLRLNGFERDHARDVARIFASGQRMLLRKWRGELAQGKGGEGEMQKAK